MQKLILIRHANVTPDPDMPNEAWPLTPEGERRCHVLAERLQALNIVSITTSCFPKAIKTGAILAELLDLPLPAQNCKLNEHDRSTNAPFFESRVAFEAAVAALFANPTELSYGAETAQAMSKRFQKGIDEVVASAQGQTIAIVSHGTVMASLFGKLKTSSPFESWLELQAFGMPSYAVVDLASWSIESFAGLD